MSFASILGKKREPHTCDEINSQRSNNALQRNFLPMSSLPYFFVDTKRRVRKFRENVGVSLLFWATIKKTWSRFIVNVQVTHYSTITQFFTSVPSLPYFFVDTQRCVLKQFVGCSIKVQSRFEFQISIKTLHSGSH